MNGTRPATRPWIASFGLALVVCVLPGLGGCATTSALSQARTAEQRQDYDAAVVEYTKAVRLDPDNPEARMGLQRAKLRASQEHFQRGRRLEGQGKNEEALVEFQLAAELNPTSSDVASALRNARQRVQTQVALDREGQTPLEALIQQSRNLSPPGLELPVITLPDSLVFRNAGVRDIFIALGRLADINVVFDPGFRDSTLSVDLRSAPLEDALTSVSTSSRNFYRVTAPRTVTIVPDTPAKRREYEEEIVRTFYLSNVDLKEAMDLLRIVIDARRIAPVNATNAITIKDTPERIAAAARVLNAIDKARAEVVINVELLEVDRTKLAEYGLQIASPGSPGINGQVDVNQPGLTLNDLRNLTSADVFVTNVPGLFYRLLKTDTNTRVLASPQLRTSDGLAAQARFGERVPVPVTTFAPIATGGVNQQPITSFNYENIGVNIDITPRTHHDGDVSLNLRVEISAISGTGFGDLPTFGNRSINTTIRLHDGETNLLAGLIRDDERTVLNGVPGLSDLPVVGRLFAHNRRETETTDIVLMLTPHIIRVLDLSEADLQPFKVGREATSPLLDLPAFDQPTTVPDTPVQPGQVQPPPQPPAVVPGPIRPPVPQQPAVPPPQPPPDE
jgi:general secretion pathway protein D